MTCTFSWPIWGQEIGQKLRLLSGHWEKKQGNIRYLFLIFEIDLFFWSCGFTILNSSFEDPVNDYSIINSKLGIPISNAMLAFDGGKYDEAVKLLKPVELEVVNIGGSDAQVNHTFVVK